MEETTQTPEAKPEEAIAASNQQPQEETMEQAEAAVTTEAPAALMDASQRLAPEEVCDLEPRDAVEISLRSLLQAGVHYGHQTSRWNPKMAGNIHSVRNGIHIINLPKTMQAWEAARKAIVDIASKGGQVLFVGTKKQAQDAMVEEARRCGAFYVSRRWLGGMMTNFQTVRKSIDRMKKLETILAEEEQIIRDGGTSKFKKKERLMMSRELDKLLFSLSGIREMHRAPDLIFAVDIKREDIAIKEANRLDIPVIALVDTNCDPSAVTYPIPSNDDGSRALRLFAAAVSDAVNEGKKLYVPKAVKKDDKNTNRSYGKKGNNRGGKGRAAKGKKDGAASKGAQSQKEAPAKKEAPATEKKPAETSEA